ncbi:GntR family transcriptional regulator [Parvibacter caecicola]|uniref:GntR family transcriptional regulator n=1 Tax=Parvibacter caecicola TaxID=747645 RepID=UPI0023F14FA5|nr:GntR family transcriptional regulator [Parvibacter caecicola]
MFPFEVDEASDLPLWVQLRQRIAYLITSGYFKPGEKLPTVRGLASEISINYNTVNKAYLSLVSDGFLESTRGRGVFVTDIAQKMGADEVDRVTAILNDCIEACREMGMSLDEVDQAMTRRIREIKLEEARRDGKLAAHIVDFPDARAGVEERGA